MIPELIYGRERAISRVCECGTRPKRKRQIQPYDGPESRRWFQYSRGEEWATGQISPTGDSGLSAYKSVTAIVWLNRHALLDLETGAGRRMIGIALPSRRI
jgi:hypothetical protein